eukprot:TRINITY_DN1854_c0_g1_i1.p1 TRINITY_DN1854_c0_g1~~TRINITY_DN1854_c0_g1_i1.p1  ORF type:complete len:924 (+),score=194.54 TRINITY_DN1854_c0_g1_i1:40-2772(+)
MARPGASRFTLLDVEEGEEYLEDFAAFYYPSARNDAESMRAKQKGRLRLCTRSLVFEPDDVKFPLVRLPFREMDVLARSDPARTGSPFAAVDVFRVLSRTTVLMKENGVTAPFVFEKEPRDHRFSFPYVSMLGFLRTAQEIHTINKADVITRDAKLEEILAAKQRSFEFDVSWLEDLHDKTLFECNVIRQTPLVSTRGKILVTTGWFYFQPLTNVAAEPVLKFQLSRVLHALPRRHLLRHTGVEIFIKDRSSLFLAFKTREQRDELLYVLKQHAGCDGHADIHQATQEWRDAKLSNFDYLMLLNEHAGRSFMDLTQYPVFPWVVSDYTSPVLDLNKPSVFRDLAKPVGALNAKRLAELRQRYHHMPIDPENPRFLYGTHYSAPGYVLYFLVRKSPELMLKLHGGKFDLADRMFSSIADTWTGVLSNPSDVKELIPEFYMPPGDFLANLQHLDLGVRKSGQQVADVELPAWAENARDFTEKMRAALESQFVSEQLHLWIDLIFGYKQRGDEADRADNLFYHLTYEGAVNMDSITDPMERTARERQIQEFGQTPSQLFTVPHPPRRIISTPSKPMTPVIRDTPLSPMTLPREASGDVLTSGTAAATAAVLGPWGPFSSHKLTATFTSHREAVVAVCMDDSGDRIFSCSKDGTLKLFSIPERKQLRSTSMPSDMALSALCVVKDGSLAVVGSWDNNVYLYSFQYGRVMDTLTAHDDAVSAVVMRDDSLLTASWDSSVKLWRATTGSKLRHPPVAELLEHDGEVKCLDMTANGQTAVSGASDGTMIVWDLRAKRSARTLRHHTGPVMSVQITPDGSSLVSCGDDSTLRVIELRSGRESLAASSRVALTSLATDGQVAVVAGQDKIVRVMDLQRGEEKTLLRGVPGGISCVAVSANGARVVAGCEDPSNIVVWEA